MKTVLRSRFFGTAMVTVAAVALSQAVAWAESGGAKASWIKDLDIRQRDIARIAPLPTPGATDSTKLAVSATVDRPNRTYRHGDNLVLTVKTTEDAYVWVLDTGTSGKVHQIFPNRHEKNNFVRAHAPLKIPGAGSKYDLAVSHPKGTELITVIASKNNTPLTRDLVDDALAAGPFLALRGNASSVAKDLSITLRKKHPVWARDHQAIRIE